MTIAWDPSSVVPPEEWLPVAHLIQRIQAATDVTDAQIAVIAPPDWNPYPDPSIVVTLCGFPVLRSDCVSQVGVLILPRG